MSFKHSVLLGLWLCVVPFAVNAEGSAPDILVVNVQKVISDSISGKAARNNIEAEVKKGQAKLAGLKSDFDKEKESLDKQSSLLSGSAVEEKGEALQRKERDFQRAAQDIQEDLMRKNNAQIGKVVEQVNVIVKEMAKERDISFVLERDEQFVLYADNRIDVTNDVIKALDKQKVAL